MSILFGFAAVTQQLAGIVGLASGPQHAKDALGIIAGVAAVLGVPVVTKVTRMQEARRTALR